MSTEIRNIVMDFNGFKALNGISLKNIGIINNREFEEGVLRIEFYDEDALESAISVLKERNYTIHRR